MTEQSIQDRIMSRNNATQGHPSVEAEEAESKSTPKKSWLRMAAFSALGIVLVAGAGFGAMQLPAIQNLFSQEVAAAPSAADPNLPNTPFLAHAKEAGIQACGTVFPVLGQLLTGGAKYSVQSDWSPAEPDKHAIRSLVGLNIASKDYSGPAAGLIVASPNGSSCEGTMIRIVPYQQTCDAVAKILPAGSTKRSDLSQTIVYDLANNGGQLMLLPSSQACVAISVAQAARK
ncbi:hypothetical protein [Agrobacterium sp. LMR679]|uniref:hypothetical protein n=1 Tax=Agrobacterium sp. LMR679 TaxID=3014335 RepID=UPI0022AE6D70|nr:hypothetical protein [Agrobacterium sp. LMR679]MCZ4072107.1 hypothetical protein [Agrobacterium sp. LMR679]